jgi:hypothetical protein
LYFCIRESFTEYSNFNAVGHGNKQPVLLSIFQRQFL